MFFFWKNIMSDYDKALQRARARVNQKLENMGVHQPEQRNPNDMTFTSYYEEPKPVEEVTTTNLVKDTLTNFGVGLNSLVDGAVAVATDTASNIAEYGTITPMKKVGDYLADKTGFSGYSKIGEIADSRNPVGQYIQAGQAFNRLIGLDKVNPDTQTGKLAVGMLTGNATIDKNKLAQEVNQATKKQQRQEWLNSNKSTGLRQMENDFNEKFHNINTGSQVGDLWESVKLFADNPYLATQQAVQSLPSMALASVTKNPLAVASLTEGISGYGEAKDYAQQNNLDLNDTKVQAHILASGLGNAGITYAGGRLAHKLGGGDISTLSRATGLSSAIKGTAVDMGEEGLIALNSTVNQNIMSGKQLTQDTGKNIGHAMALSGAMSGALQAPSVLGSKATKKADNALYVPYEQLLDSQHDKYNPSKAFTRAYTELHNAKDTASKTKAKEHLNKAKDEAFTYLTSLDERIRVETDEKNKAKLIGFRNKFYEEHIKPITTTINLQETNVGSKTLSDLVDSYINPTKSNTTGFNKNKPIAIMGSYTKARDQVGAGSADHFDVSVRSANVNPNSYFDRFTVDGKTLNYYANTFGFKPEQVYGAKRSYGGHRGYDFSINKHFGGKAGKELLVSPEWADKVKSISYGKSTGKDKKGNHTGYGNYTDITFTDGVTIRIGHQDDTGINKVKTYHGNVQTNQQTTQQVNIVLDPDRQKVWDMANTSADVFMQNFSKASESVGLTKADWQRYIASTLYTESRGKLDIKEAKGTPFIGKYQAGVSYLETAGFLKQGTTKKYGGSEAVKKANGWSALNDPNNWNHGLDLQKFLNSHELQDKAFANGTMNNLNQMIKSGYTKGKSPKEILGLLKTAHISGVGGVGKLLSGKTVKDHNGTSNRKYYEDIVNDGDGFTTGLSTVAINTDEQNLQDTQTKIQQEQLKQNQQDLKIQELQNKKAQLELEQQQQANQQTKQQQQTNQNKVEEVIPELMKRFSTVTLDNVEESKESINRLSKSGVISESQANDLIKLLDIKMRIKADDTDKVHSHIIHGFKGGNETLENNLGIDQYDEIFAHGNKDTKLKYMGYLTRFRDDHVSKANAIQSALAKYDGKPITLAYSGNKNSWIEIDDPSILTDNSRKFVVNTSNPNKAMETIFKEAELLDEFTKTYQSIFDSLESKPTETSYTPSKPSSKGIQFKGVESWRKMKEIDPDGIWVDYNTTISLAMNIRKGNTKLGQFGNPFNTKTTNKKWKVANQKEAIEKYIELFTHKYVDNSWFKNEVDNLRDKTLYFKKNTEGKGTNTDVPFFIKKFVEATRDLPHDEQINFAKQKLSLVGKELYADGKPITTSPVTNNTDTATKADTIPNNTNIIETKPNAVETPTKVEPSNKESVITPLETKPVNKTTQQDKPKTKEPQSVDDWLNDLQETAGQMDNAELEKFANLDLQRQIHDNQQENYIDTSGYQPENNYTDTSGNQETSIFTIPDEVYENDVTFTAEPVNEQTDLPNIIEEKPRSAIVSKSKAVSNRVKTVESLKQITPKALKDSSVNNTLKGSHNLAEILDSLTLNEQQKIIVSAISQSYPDLTASLDGSKADVSAKTIDDFMVNLVEFATKDALNQLNELEYDTSKDFKELPKQTRKLITLKNELDQISSTLKNLSNLGKEQSDNVIKATQSYQNLIALGINQNGFGKFLKTIETKGKVTSNLFTKLINGLQSFLGIPAKTEINNYYEKLLNAVALAIEIQKPDNNGNLSIFDGVTKETRKEELNKPYKERNVLVSGIHQENTTNLSKVKDLVSRIKLYGTSEISRLNQDKPNKVQHKQLEHFIEFREKFSEYLIASFFDKETKYKYQDLKSFLNIGTHDNPKFDENLLTALSLTAYDYTVINGSRARHDKKGLYRALGIDEETTSLDYKVTKKYAFIGNSLGSVTVDMGKTVSKLLGFKQYNDVPQDTLARLEASLGNWVVSAMQVADLVYIHTVPMDIYKADTNQAVTDEDKHKSVRFVSYVEFDGKNPSQLALQISKLGKGTKGYLNDLFGLQSSKKYPTLTPPEATNKIDKTKSKISKTQKERIQKMQDEPMVINQDMSGIMQKLKESDEDFLLDLFKARVTPEQLSKIHITRQESKLASAEGNLRDLENYFDWKLSLPSEDTSFYDRIKIAVNRRMHYVSNVINFQSSKVHRALVELKNFKTTIDLSNFDINNLYDEQGKPKDYTLFLRAVLENAEGTEKIFEQILIDKGLSKGATVDKVSSANIIPLAWEYLTTDDKVIQAVSAVSDLQQGKDLTQEQKQAILTLVKQWDMGGQSFRALVELTNFMKALKDSKPFTTSFGISSDGLNNGTGIGAILMGIIDNRLLERVGIFLSVSNHRNYFSTRSDPEVTDYYTGLAPILLNSINLVEKTNVSQAYKVLNTSLASRKTLKALLIPFGYGAGNKSLKISASNRMYEDIIDQLESIANDLKSSDSKVVELAQLKRNEIEHALQQILGNKFKLNKDLLSHEFTYAEINKLKETYIKTYGKALTSAVNAYGSKIVQGQTLNVNISNTAHEAYTRAKDIIVERANELHKQRLKEKYGEVGKDLLDYETLTTNEIKEFIEKPLANILPKIHDAYSHYDSLDNALEISKEENTLLPVNTESKTYQYTEQGDLRLVKDSPFIKGKQETNISVRPHSQHIQSTDSVISSEASTAGVVTQNFHDANGTGINNHNDMVINQNKAFFNNTVNFHIFSESMFGLLRTLQGILDSDLLTELEKNNIITQTKIKIGEILKIDNGLVTLTSLDNLVDTALEHDFNKIRLYRDVESIHQYSGEGGEYYLTEADRNTIEEQFIIIETNREELHKMVDDINKEIFKPTKSSFNPDKVTNTNTKLFNLNSLKLSVDKLQTNQSSKDVFTMLTGLIDKHNPKLLIKVSKLSEKHYGAYNKDNQIELNETLFKSKDVQDELKLKAINHELIHALTETGLTKDTQASKDIKAMYEQLKEVYKQSLDKHEIIDKALENVYEFVAYGLTDKTVASFIGNNLDLKKLGIKPKSKLTKVIDTFLSAIYSMLGLNKNTSYKTFVDRVNQSIENYDSTITGFTETDYRASSVETEVNAKEVTDVFKELNKGNVTEQHNKHLDSLIDKFLGVFYKNSSNTKFVKLTDGLLQNTAVVQGFVTSDKENYVNEAMTVMVNEYLNHNKGTLAFNGLNKLYTQAQEHFKSVKDLFPQYTSVSKSEQQRLQKMFQYLFNNKTKQDNVARFVAMALTNEEFREVLDKHKFNDIKANGTWFDKIMRISEEITGRMNNTWFRADSKDNTGMIGAYVNSLNSLEIKARNHQVDKIQSAYEKLQSTLYNFGDRPFKTVLGTLFDNDYLRNSDIRFLRNVGRVGKIINSNINPSEYISSLYAKANDRHTTNKFLMETINEVLHQGIRGNVIDKLVSKTQAIAQARKRVKDSTFKQLQQVFSKPLDKKQKTAITYAVIRTDLSSLLTQGFSADKALSMLNETNRNKAITEYSKQLKELVKDREIYNDMLHQINSLGLNMVTDETAKGLVKSAYGVAMGFGSWYETEQPNKDIYKVVDILSTLYALNHVEENHIIDVTLLTKNEKQGLIDTMRLHEQLVKQSKEDFEYNKYNYVKGYTVEITHPNRKLVFATTAEEVNQLKEQGFVHTTKLKQDNNDKSIPRYLMIHTNYSSNKYVSGALDLYDTHGKGSIVYTAGVDNQKISDTTQDILKYRRHRAKFNVEDVNPRTTTGSLQATYRSDGSILNYHYEMEGRTKDTYLERNNDFDLLLATQASDLVFKPAIRNHQIDVAKALVKDTKEHFSKAPDEYIFLNLESIDPSVQAMVRMIPYTFRKELQKAYGRGNLIPIHKNMYNATFGFQAYSLVEAFDKVYEPEKRLNLFEKLLVDFSKMLFKENARKRVLQLEQVVQKLMTLIKDIIVVRSGKVALGNILSNLSLLMLHGINPIKVITDTTFAWRNIKNYKKYAIKLSELEAELKTKRSNINIGQIKRQIKTLNQLLEKNPMHKYMEYGLMSTIVEDINTDLENDGKYKTPFEEYIEKYTKKIPTPLKTVFNEVVFNKGSTVHNFLTEATSFSDLSAKYVLANHLQQKGMDLDKAIYQSNLSFINYDVPTNKTLDYLNRIGLANFTKYYLRIQYMLGKLILKAPITALLQHNLVESLGSESVMNSLWINRFGNPLDSSIFMGLDVSDDLLATRLIGELFT